MTTESVESILNRLNHYYSQRAQVADKSLRTISAMRGDSSTVTARTITLSQWEAKCDAVVAVAKNLGIRLREVPQGYLGVQEGKAQ